MLKTKENHIYLSDIVTGVVAGLSKLGVRYLDYHGNKIDRVFCKLYEDIQTEAERRNLELRFIIQADPLHGDSDDIQEEFFVKGMRRGIISHTMGTRAVNIEIEKNRADKFMERLPGGVEMYEGLAEKFKEYYKNDGDARI